MHTRLTWLLAPLLSAVWAAAPAATETEIPQGLWQAFSEARHAIEPRGADYIAHDHGNDQRITFGAEDVVVMPLVPGATQFPSLSRRNSAIPRAAGVD